VGEGVLSVEGLELRAIAAAVGTPVYVYSANHVRAQYRALDAALAGVPHRIHYSVKANGNLAVLALLRSLGAGVDIVSSGELVRARAAGYAGADVVFSGVGKTGDEMRAALHAGVGLLNVESEEELEALDAVARAEGRVAPVAIRVNPEVTVDTHPYTVTGAKGKKFGVPHDEVEVLARRAARMEGVRLRGLAMHVGSQITDTAPFTAGLARLLELVERIRAAGVSTLDAVDIGGGLGIRYRESDQPLDVGAYAAAVVPMVAGTGLRLLVEPGRYLVGNAGVLLTRVLYRKRSGGRMIAVIDAGMNDLIRPSHYQAWHEIAVDGAGERPHVHYDVVGPICETGDFFALDRDLPALEQGDLLVVRGAGAYGFVMTSTYNARPRPPELLVDGDRFAVVREREAPDAMLQGEHAAPAWQRLGAGVGT
jgi:diaminopimelate decarboxylase